MKKTAFILICVLTLIFVFAAGCTPESGENSNESKQENAVSDTVSDEMVFVAPDWRTESFYSFEELAQLISLANGDDENAFNEFFEKDGIIPPRKDKVKAIFANPDKIPVIVLESEKYELAVISLKIYYDSDALYIEFVYNGALDRLRVGAYTYDGTVEPDETITDVVTDTLTLGEHSMQMHTVVKENNYCTLKGRIVSDDYVVYAHYKGDTVLPESLKEGVTLTTLEELIKPYVK